MSIELSTSLYNVTGRQYQNATFSQYGQNTYDIKTIINKNNNKTSINRALFKFLQNHKKCHGMSNDATYEEHCESDSGSSIVLVRNGGYQESERTKDFKRDYERKKASMEEYERREFVMERARERDHKDASERVFRQERERKRAVEQRSEQSVYLMDKKIKEVQLAIKERMLEAETCELETKKEELNAAKIRHQTELVNLQIKQAELQMRQSEVEVYNLKKKRAREAEELDDLRKQTDADYMANVITMRHAKADRANRGMESD